VAAIDLIQEFISGTERDTDSDSQVVVASARERKQIKCAVSEDNVRNEANRKSHDTMVRIIVIANCDSHSLRDIVVNDISSFKSLRVRVTLSLHDRVSSIQPLIKSINLKNTLPALRSQ
jgi:hypothetical protein